MRVLVVDDNAADRKILRYVLERHDSEVIDAGDGEQGFQQAERHVPDLIISDALMPRMDGFEFLHRIKAAPALRHIPFIFYSSVYTGDRDEKLARSLGADAFMVKPKEPEEIWQEIERVVERARSREGTSHEVEEEEYLRQYSRIVTAKVEEKVRELERANEVIRQRAKSYRNLFNSIRDVIIVTDDDRIIADANQPALRDAFGYELHEVQGKDVRILYADDDGYRASAVPVARKRPEAGSVLEVPFTKKSGDTFIGELSLIRRLGEEGVPTGNIGIIRDISERKRVEEALRTSERERYQLEAELRLAAEVQAKLLPRSSPLLPGFEISAACFPARQIGGDFYDWLEISPGVIAVTLGDVMGHGLAAAVLMAEVRATVRSLSAHNEPEKAMQRVEYALRHDLERSEAFVTMFHARVEGKSRTLTFVDCGHGFAFLRRADGWVEELLPRGLPIGVPSRERYQEGRLTFEPGDALVLYSDGLIDARPELELTPKLLARCLEGSANSREMVERLTSLPGVPSPPPDDLTVLVVLCKP
ncbi:SpoIIE family protein phosphatase [Geomonas sp. RF6]|uniref:SpoIIE family protein phosphatase n=1 Tax=Geomonas sp. RF6 TaxID=2897342 RepID=UPI001E53274C|nr:SpoIIE family protein phosphatase [Geomonas sp. RF6]UFS70988.1 SpoIIE family protein phosphatase [Geomonas sp. RF6]